MAFWEHDAIILFSMWKPYFTHFNTESPSKAHYIAAWRVSFLGFQGSFALGDDDDDKKMGCMDTNETVCTR